MRIDVPSRFAGPPEMGHGGYVAGLLAEHGSGGAVQVTLRRTTPLDVPLELEVQGDARVVLRDGEHLIAEAEPSTLTMDVPTPPSLAAASAAEADSPSLWDERGVHPICFGCGRLREPGDALRIFAGPLEVQGHEQVAGAWRPGDAFAEGDGSVARRWVLAALDCPGAFAFIARGTSAGLLGRIVFEQHREVRSDADHVVTGWQIGGEGRKLYAGTALFDAGGELLAAARATWFQMGGAG